MLMTSLDDDGQWGREIAKLLQVEQNGRVCVICSAHMS